MIPLLLVFSAACAFTDLRTRQIPNALTLGGALAGFAFHIWGLDGEVWAFRLSDLVRRLAFT